MKIIDSFMFFDEKMMLDIRLNILDKYVTHFVICEAKFNHKGKSKNLILILVITQNLKTKSLILCLRLSQKI